jgi:hypothetical protein
VGRESEDRSTHAHETERRRRDRAFRIAGEPPPEEKDERQGREVDDEQAEANRRGRLPEHALDERVGAEDARELHAVGAGIRRDAVQ